jgi:hypothetical protein
MKHIDWNDLSQGVRDLVQARTGPVRGRGRLLPG